VRAYEGNGNMSGVADLLEQTLEIVPAKRKEKPN